MVLMVLVADQRRVFPLVCWPFAAHRPSECKGFGESSESCAIAGCDVELRILADFFPWMTRR